MTERYRRLDTGRLELQVTFDDPKTYSRPWTIHVNGALLPDSELIEAVCNENEKDAGRYVGDASGEARVISLPAATLARYAGDYNAGPIGTLHVAISGDALSLVMPAGGSHRIVARSEEDFLVPDLGTPVRFLTGPSGEVTHLRITIVEGDIEAPRTK